MIAAVSSHPPLWVLTRFVAGRFVRFHPASQRKIAQRADLEEPRFMVRPELKAQPRRVAAQFCVRSYFLAFSGLATT